MLTIRPFWTRQRGIAAEQRREGADDGQHADQVDLDLTAEVRVAERDFVMLTYVFAGHDGANSNPEAALRGSAAALIAYAAEHKAGYRLLFSDPQLPADARLKGAAFGAFMAFGRIVARCRRDGALPDVDIVRLTGLIYATLHGAIDLDLGGRAGGTKGWAASRPRRTCCSIS